MKRALQKQGSFAGAVISAIRHRTCAASRHIQRHEITTFGRRAPPAAGRSTGRLPVAVGFQKKRAVSAVRLKSGVLVVTPCVMVTACGMTHVVLVHGLAGRVLARVCCRVLQCVLQCVLQRVLQCLVVTPRVLAQVLLVHALAKRHF